MVMSRRLVCVCGDGTSGKVVVGHGVGVGIAVGRGVNFERMARGVQLFPGETHSIRPPQCCIYYQRQVPNHQNRQLKRC